MKSKKCLKNKRGINDIIEGTTCFSQHEQCGVKCLKQECRQWINNEDSYNCVLIAATKGPKTLQEIGNIYSITRMRICQIEKNALLKLKKRSKKIFK